MKRNNRMSITSIRGDSSITTDMSSLSASSVSVGSDDSKKNSIEGLTSLQRRVLKVKKFQREQTAKGKVGGGSVAMKKERDYESWKAKRAMKKSDGSKVTNGAFHRMDTKRASNYTAICNGKQNAKKKELTKIMMNDIRLSLPPPPPPPYQPPTKTKMTQKLEAPFDEYRHEKVEVVALPSNETVILDKSRHIRQSISVDEEEEEANRRRRELLQRAKALIGNRNDSGA